MRTISRPCAGTMQSQSGAVTGPMPRSLVPHHSRHNGKSSPSARAPQLAARAQPIRASAIAHPQGTLSSSLPRAPLPSSMTRRAPVAGKIALSPCRAVRADADAEASASAASPQLLQAIAEITATVDARVQAALEASAAHAAQAAAAATAGDAELNGSKSALADTDNSAASLLRARIEASVLQLQRGLLERDTEVRLMLLAALCGEHLLLLGPPGTAKSELSRRLSGLLGGQQGGTQGGGSSGAAQPAAAGEGCTYFERLLTRFSVPEELFGPLSMRGLENDQYVRQTDGYLPTAEVAFVDGEDSACACRGGGG